MTKILVVDDDPVIVMFLTEYLTSMGYEVIGTASDAQEAIEKTASLKPDLILMDIVLSHNTDGITAAQQILKQNDIPIIFISGHKSDAYLQKVKACGASGFIIKPIEPWQLKASIEIALHNNIFDQEVKEIKSQLQEQVKEQTATLKKINRDLQQSLLEYKQIESELRAGEEKYRKLLDCMNEGFVLTDIEGTISYVNKKFLDLLGYEEGEVVSHFLTEFTDDEGKKIIPKQRALREKRIFDPYEVMFIRKDGRPVYTLISPQVFTDEKGRIKGRFGTVTDISSLKHIQAAYRRDEAHLRSLMDTASHFAIFRLIAEPTQTLGFRVVFASPSISEIMGIAEPMDFSTWFINIHPEEKSGWFEMIRESLVARDFNQTLRLYFPQNKVPRWVQMFSQSVVDPKSIPPMSTAYSSMSAG